ncbi:MAG: Rrf2 family transcriptional regulator [Calditrichaeota bacterium]|nr:MAG: Rrf2 family transcriptional regulator [Calditrichota bacterium]
MLLSKSCVYGIRALLYLSVNRDREYVPISEISELLGISFHFLTKILQELTAVGIVKSRKGIKGGVALAQPADKITLYNIIMHLDGEALFNECVLGLPGCADDNPCSMHKIWSSVKKELQGNLQTETLAHLARQIDEGNIRLYDYNFAID